jgi:TonB family protein
MGEARVRFWGRTGILTLMALLGAMRGNAHEIVPVPQQTPPPFQSSARVAPAPGVTPARDAALDATASLVGRAIFIRNGYAGSELTYDVLGHVRGAPKQLDWTLAGADIEKVERRSPVELELDGVRVALRYNPDQHVFERHPQKDQKLKVLLAVNDAARGLQGALATIFAVGIDPGLQRAMPPHWRHYFSPGLAWPSDDLTGQPVVALSAPVAGVEMPAIEKKVEPGFTGEARQDRVKGVVGLKLTVGADGVPRRIAIRQPLGYGLDESAVQAVAKYRFRPGRKDGQPVAVEMLVNQTFDYYQPPRP